VLGGVSKVALSNGHSKQFLFSLLRRATEASPLIQKFEKRSSLILLVFFKATIEYFFTNWTTFDCSL
jgi:hypothetical protein